ncbi:MAG: hypothetical protein ACREP9_05015, partial [Candidatus Dormibacteraceae bacterium]
ERQLDMEDANSPIIVFRFTWIALKLANSAFDVRGCADRVSRRHVAAQPTNIPPFTSNCGDRPGHDAGDCSPLKAS